MIGDLLGDAGPPVPDGLPSELGHLDIGDSMNHVSDTSSNKIFLRGICEISIPNYDVAFLQFGGSMNALTSDGRTQLSVSGAKSSLTINDGEFAIELNVDNDHMSIKEGVLQLPSNATVRVQTSPQIVDAMMTVGEKVTGEGVLPLLRGLVNRQLIIPLTYRTWMSQYGTVALTNLYVERNGKTIDIQEVPPKVSFDRNEELLIGYNNEATKRRDTYYLQETEGLSKPVTFTPIGYMPLRHILRRNTGLTQEGLESWLDSAIRIVVNDDAKVDALYAEFASPKKKPDNEAARIVANAFTTILYSQSSYSYDGHERITPQGVEFVNSEQWNENEPESVVHTDDCDAAMQANAMAHQLSIGAQAVKDFVNNTATLGPAGRFCCNALFHYETAMAVTLASAGSGGELDDKPKLAGHATVLFLPIANILEAVERGVELETPDADVATQMASLFEHFYPPDKRKALGNDGDDWTLQEAMQEFQTAEPFVGEGTILSESRAYYKERSDRTEASLQLLGQKKKLSELGPTLMSAYHDLTTNPRTHTHEFYLKWVEATFLSSMPIGDKMVSQFVFTRYPFKSANKRIDSGTTPEQLVNGEYAFVPLAHEDQFMHKHMEDVYSEFRHHRMATRTDRPLTDVQNKNILKNLARLDAFATFIETLPDTDSSLTRIHALFPPRVMLGNNASFEHTLNQLKTKVKAGVIRRFPLDSSLGYIEDKTTGVFMVSAVFYM